MNCYRFPSMTRMTIAGILLAMAAPYGMTDPVGVTSKYDLSLYGYVKLDASYDSQRTAAGNLMFFVLPEKSGHKDDEFNLTARETRLGLRLRVPDVNGTRVTGVVETDFYGGGSENSANLRTRLAYVDLERGNWALRAGQDWETFIVTIPRIVNFSYLADAGALGLRRPQVRVSHVTPFGEKTRLIAKVAAARTIGEDIDGGGQDDGAAAGYPSAQGSLVLESKAFTTRPVVLGMSGHFGPEQVSAYSDATNPEAPVMVDEEDYDSWSAIGSLGLPFTDMVMLQGAIWIGENLDNYFGGIGQGINKAKQTAIAAEGGWAQLVLDPCACINLNLGYGLDNPASEDLNAGQRSKNELFFGNVFYRMNEAVTLAFELSHLTTSYLGGKDAEDIRGQGSVIFKF